MCGGPGADVSRCSREHLEPSGTGRQSRVAPALFKAQRRIESCTRIGLQLNLPVRGTRFGAGQEFLAPGSKTRFPAFFDSPSVRCYTSFSS